MLVEVVRVPRARALDTQASSQRWDGVKALVVMILF